MNKKLLSLTIAVSICAAMNAQITLNESDFVSVGKNVDTANDTLPDASITEGGMGAQTWDFSKLNAHQVYSVDYVDPSTTPNQSSFPSSNICSEFNSNYQYYVSNSSAITNLGAYVNLNIGTTTVSMAIKNTPAETIINFPTTNGASFTSNFTSAGKAPVVYLGSDSGKVNTVTKKSVVFDAYGSMTTPLGTYNTLRSKEYSTSITTISLHFNFIGWQNVQTTYDTTTTYKWFGNGLGAELVSANYNDSLGKIDYVSWLYTLSAGVKEHSNNSVAKVYPTPANDVVYVENIDPKAEYITVFDINGKQVISQRIIGKVTAISTVSLSPGFYSYAILDNSNSSMGHGKIAITH